MLYKKMGVLERAGATFNAFPTVFDWLLAVFDWDSSVFRPCSDRIRPLFDRFSTEHGWYYGFLRCSYIAPHRRGAARDDVSQVKRPFRILKVDILPLIILFAISFVTNVCTDEEWFLNALLVIVYICYYTMWILCWKWWLLYTTTAMACFKWFD